MIHAGTHDLTDLAQTVQRAVQDLRPYADQFDSIVTSGTSGLVVASPVALALGKPLVIVRKEDDGPRCWHAHDVENAEHAGRRTLFLDDEVQRGRTLTHVKRQLARNTNATVVARYEYTERQINWERSNEYAQPTRGWTW